MGLHQSTPGPRLVYFHFLHLFYKNEQKTIRIKGPHQACSTLLVGLPLQAFVATIMKLKARAKSNHQTYRDPLG